MPIIFAVPPSFSHISGYCLLPKHIQRHRPTYTSNNVFSHRASLPSKSSSTGTSGIPGYPEHFGVLGDASCHVRARSKSTCLLYLRRHRKEKFYEDDQTRRGIRRSSNAMRDIGLPCPPGRKYNFCEWTLPKHNFQWTDFNEPDFWWTNFYELDFQWTNFDEPDFWWTSCLMNTVYWTAFHWKTRFNEQDSIWTWHYKWYCTLCPTKVFSLCIAHLLFHNFREPTWPKYSSAPSNPPFPQT